MTIDEALHDGAVVLRVSGRIDDDEAAGFRETLLAALSRAEHAVLVDLNDAPHITAAGFRSLVLAQRAAKSAGKRLAVFALNDGLHEVFAISRFHDTLAVHTDLAAALNAAMAP